MGSDADPTVGEIPTDWEFTTLGEVCRRGGGYVQTGPFGSQLHAADYVPVGVPSVMPFNLRDNWIDPGGIAQITEADAQRLSRHRLRPGNIVFSRRGDVELRALVREPEAGWMCGTGCLKIDLGEGVVDPLFASLYLGHPDVRRWIVTHAVGSTMPNLNTAIMSGVPFALPPLPEQQAIAGVLGALDDKIAANRRLCRTLEALGRAVFRSWFVDFDPVTARAAGRRPVGMTADVAKLFPTTFADSPLGPISKGWEVKPIGEVVEDVFDGPHATPPEATSGAVFLGIKNLTGTQLDLSEVRHIGEPDWPRWTRRVTPRHNDIVFSYEAALGMFALVPPGLRCCLGRRLALVRPKASECGPRFLFHTFTSSNFQEFLESRTIHGSTVDRISLNDFPTYPILWPPATVRQAFEGLAGPLWDRIHNAQQQSRTLAGLRDALLPRLLSGELRVRAAERAVAEVV